MTARGRLALGLLLGLGLALAAWSARVRAPVPDQAPVGLFTTLPILWNEADDVAALLNDTAPPHWARAALGQTGKIVPLDLLAGPQGPGPLDRLERLVIAQPRPLSPDENVALDDWVRGGGRLLLIVDPALTEESRHALGDPRRPQDMVLLSPILRRWGLALTFDDAQPAGERGAEVLGVTIPVNLPGRFSISDPSGCVLLDGGLAARCAVGKGHVLALADAAVLERLDSIGARREALDALLAEAFAPR